MWGIDEVKEDEGFFCCCCCCVCVCVFVFVDIHCACRVSLSTVVVHAISCTQIWMVLGGDDIDQTHARVTSWGGKIGVQHGELLNCSGLLLSL